jgi:hypothetical protein
MSTHRRRQAFRKSRSPNQPAQSDAHESNITNIGNARVAGHERADMAQGCKTVPVLPNLDRISSKGDQRAERTLAQTPRIADADVLAAISADVALDFRRYGIRQTTVALRRRSIDALTDALWATVLGAASEPEGRDLMVGLALPHVVAREVGANPAALFAEIADRVPDTPVAQILAQFGPRRDVDLPSFGWAQVETSDGPDFVPTP